ncbi:MAG: ATP synthase F0 subunit B [Alphaproteobacteria bacterium]|nr:ATP synthase F0 subunit B [Alphaproteobacteria bacterium]
MFSTPEFWVFIAFVLLLGGLGKRGFSFATQTLDEHRKRVIHQLNEAQRLHDEALSLLNVYKKKHEDALEQAAKIISYAEKEAQELKKSSQQELELFIHQKEKALLERIALEKEETKTKFRQQVVDEALKIVERHLLTEKKERDKLTMASLKEIPTLF